MPSQFHAKWTATLRPREGGSITIQFDMEDKDATTVDIFHPPPDPGTRPKPTTQGKFIGNFITFTLNISGMTHHFYGAHKPGPGAGGGGGPRGIIDGVFVNVMRAAFEAQRDPASLRNSDDGGWVGSQPRSS